MVLSRISEIYSEDDLPMEDSPGSLFPSCFPKEYTKWIKIFLTLGIMGQDHNHKNNFFDRALQRSKYRLHPETSTGIYQLESNSRIFLSQLYKLLLLFCWILAVLSGWAALGGSRTHFNLISQPQRKNFPHTSKKGNQNVRHCFLCAL